MSKVIFHHCSVAVIDFVNTAQSSLKIGICWFTHPAIFEAVKNALSRNVQVHLALDYDHINFHPQGLDFTGLEKMGAVVLGYTGPGLLHYKLAIADDCRVLTGSYNWTRAEQQDYVLILQDTVLARQFTAAFEDIARACRTLPDLRNTPPRQLAFGQLYHPTLWSPQDLRKRIVSGAKTWLTLVENDKEWHYWLTQQTHALALKCAGSWPVGDLWDPAAFREWLQTAPLSATTRHQLYRYCIRLQPGDVLIAVGRDGQTLGAGIVGGDPVSEVVKDEAGTKKTGISRFWISRFVQWLELPSARSRQVIVLPAGMRAGDIALFRGSALALISITITPPTPT